MTIGKVLIHATAHYGTPTRDGITRMQRVMCPVPGCGKNVPTTYSGFIADHVNLYGFTCDGVNLRPEQAAQLQVDAQGRLVGVDEMARLCVKEVDGD